MHIQKYTLDKGPVSHFADNQLYIERGKSNAPIVWQFPMHYPNSDWRCPHKNGKSFNDDVIIYIVWYCVVWQGLAKK